MKATLKDLPIEYSCKKVTPFGGMRLLKAFIDKLDILSLFNGLDLPHPKSNRGYRVETVILGFWLSIWTGASRFIHADWLRYDEVLQRLFGLTSLPCQSTYSRFFHKFSWARNEAVFVESQRRFFDYLNTDSLTVDLDSTVVTRYGEQEGARRGYNPKKPGRRSHHPLMAFIPQVKMVANAWLRPGNTADLSHCDAFIHETFDTILCQHRIGLVRADSGFYSDNLLCHLEAKALNYIVGVKFHQTIVRHVFDINQWYEIASGIDYGQFTHTLSSGVTRCYTVIRKDTGRHLDAPGKTLDLFSNDIDMTQYRYSCFVSNLNLPGDEVWRMYRGRADAENRIKELKMDFGMEQFCLSRFWATEAAFRLMMMAYNIISLFRHTVLQSKKAHTLQTLRLHCFALGAWITNHAHKQVLKIALPVKRRDWMDGIFDRINGVDPPFLISNA